MENAINLNYFYCSWCSREKLPGEDWQEGPAIIPDTALDRICPSCKKKLFEKERIKEDKKGNIVEAKAILVFRR